MAGPDPLVLDTSDLAPLRDPVLLVALTGLFDVAGVSTSALELIATADIAGRDRSLIVGEIDPDPFYDFTVERPTVEIVERDDGEPERVVTWPGNILRVVRTDAARDIVALSGVEPHLRWTTYVRCIMAVIQELEVLQVVTLGSTADVVPHTRMPVVVGSTTDRSLASKLALAPPTYQGVTGLVGVLHSELEQAGVPSVSLRVGVPHYLAMGEHPRAITSLVLHTSHVIGIPLPIDLRESIARWDEAHSASIADDEKLRRYVEVLEAEYDRRAEAAVTSADDLAASFEAYLRSDSAAKGDHPASGPHVDDPEVAEPDDDDEDGDA
jgi:hypothetical protein